MGLEELEARIKVLEDIEAIKKLKAAYCRLCDAGLDEERNLRELLSHFDENARVDFGLGEASIFEGQAGLETFLGKVVPGAVSFCMHMVHNPVIEVDGDTATGEWYYEAPTTDAASNRAQWMAGTGRRVEVRLHPDGVEVHLALRRGMGEEPGRDPGEAGGLKATLRDP
jgi:hypothetical protein